MPTWMSRGGCPLTVHPTELQVPSISFTVPASVRAIERSRMMRAISITWSRVTLPSCLMCLTWFRSQREGRGNAGFFSEADDRSDVKRWYSSKDSIEQDTKNPCGFTFRLDQCLQRAKAAQERKTTSHRQQTITKIKENPPTDCSNVSLRELDKQIFIFLAVAMAGGRVGSFVRGGETQLRTGGMIVPRSAYVVRHPRGSYIVYPLLSLEATTPQNKLIHWTLSSMYKSASKAVLSSCLLYTSPCPRD